jgi:hypothetical protein
MKIDNKYAKYTKILGLSNDNIDVNIVKKAYKQKALKLHPDKGGNEDNFKELNNAYSKILELLNLIKNGENKASNIIHINTNVTLYDIFINKKKSININGNIKTINLKNGFKEFIYLSDKTKVHLKLILDTHFQLDHKNRELKNVIELAYLDTYFVDNFSLFYTFIDGSIYKINYKKNNIIKDVFYLPEKCNFLYENKSYKFAIYVNVKKPSDIEIDLIKKAVYKYSSPKGNNHGFINSKNNENDEIKNILNKLDYMNLKEIKNFCKNKKIKGYSYYNKCDLITYIRDYFSNKNI